MDPADTLRDAAEMLSAGDEAAASALLQTAFSAPRDGVVRQTWSKERLVRVLVRDGFVDRYTGQRLVFPGALRAMSVLAPTAFPYHPNWKYGATHPAYWSHYPTIDHVVPLARGGLDTEDNVVTTPGTEPPGSVVAIDAGRSAPARSPLGPQRACYASRMTTGHLASCRCGGLRCKITTEEGS